jgi:transcriptional coactivator HFI1/ADA1
MAIATENFVKEFLATAFSRTRSNGPSGTINGTMTRRYRRQLEREEMAFTRGELVRNTANGLLPVEAKEASARQPLGVRDLRLALELGGGLLGHMPLVVSQIMGCYIEEELEAERQDYMVETLNNTDGNDQLSGMDEMDIDEVGWDWEGGTNADREELGSLLDDCLSMAA